MENTLEGFFGMITVNLGLAILVVMTSLVYIVTAVAYYKHHEPYGQSRGLAVGSLLVKAGFVTTGVLSATISYLTIHTVYVPTVWQIVLRTAMLTSLLGATLISIAKLYLEYSSNRVSKRYVQLIDMRIQEERLRHHFERSGDHRKS